MAFPGEMVIFKGSGISMGFDIIRYASIFLTSFGHNLGTNGRS